MWIWMTDLRLRPEHMRQCRVRDGQLHFAFHEGASIIVLDVPAMQGVPDMGELARRHGKNQAGLSDG